jgi:hypothetical protein
MNHAEQLAVAIQEFRTSNKVNRLVRTVNTMKAEGFDDDQINLLVSEVARAIYSEPKDTTE